MAQQWLTAIGSAGLWLMAGLPTEAAPLPTPSPIERIRSCPAGYYSSGRYCLPSARARPAIVKLGSCPTGWYSSGNYCLASDRARAVIPKLGSCPSGSYSSGKYCLLTR